MSERTVSELKVMSPDIENSLPQGALDAHLCLNVTLAQQLIVAGRRRRFQHLVRQGILKHTLSTRTKNRIGAHSFLYIIPCKCLSSGNRLLRKIGMCSQRFKESLELEIGSEGVTRPHVCHARQLLAQLVASCRGHGGRVQAGFTRVSTVSARSTFNVQYRITEQQRNRIYIHDSSTVNTNYRDVQQINRCLSIRVVVPSSTRPRPPAARVACDPSPLA
jgi:hypothetical protein